MPIRRGCVWIRAVRRSLLGDGEDQIVGQIHVVQVRSTHREPPEQARRHAAYEVVAQIELLKVRQHFETAGVHNRDCVLRRVQHLKQTFLSLDKNGDGTLTLEEIQNGCAKHKVALPDNFAAIFKGIDTGILRRLNCIFFFSI